MKAIKAVFDAEMLVTGDTRIPKGGNVKSIKLIRPSMYARDGAIEIVYYHDDLPDSPFSVPVTPDEHFKSTPGSSPKRGRPKTVARKKVEVEVDDSDDDDGKVTIS